MPIQPREAPTTRTHPVDDTSSVDVLWGQRGPAVSAHRDPAAQTPPVAPLPILTFSPFSIW